MPTYTEDLGITVVAGMMGTLMPTVVPATVLSNAGISFTAISSVSITVEVTADPPSGSGVWVFATDAFVPGSWSATCPHHVTSFLYLHAGPGPTYLGFDTGDGPCVATFTPDSDTALNGGIGLLAQGAVYGGSGTMTFAVSDIAITYTEAPCPPMGATWVPDDTQGVLEFLDAPGGTFEIPNYMVTWIERGDTELGVRATFEGEDATVLSGTAAMRRVERTRTANLALLMTFWNNPIGGVWEDAERGWHENWSTLNAISQLSVTDPDGLQTLRWTPYPGATPQTFEAHVQRPIPGEVFPGRGMKVGLVIEIPDPTGVGL